MSWLLVYYLVDHHLKRFGNFLHRLEQGVPWRWAWWLELGIPFDTLDATLDKYLRAAKFGRWKVKAKHPPVHDFEVTSLSESDALALRGFLHLQATLLQPERTADHLRWARQDLEQALSLESTLPRALELMEVLNEHTD